MTNKAALVAILILGVTLLAGPTPARASSAESEETSTAATANEPVAADDSAETMESFFATTSVTATGKEADVFTISTPVAVVPAREIEKKMPENAVDLLRDQPGVDVNGVGPNQGRPIIRGQRGLRVLFLQDGLRMNNPRRQTDFGEISGLVDMDDVEALEVVRGPASVLYGTDAIGGVLNLITKVPAFGGASRVRGSLGLRYGSASDQRRVQASADGRNEKWSFRLGLSDRDASDYDAASGTFGDIVLANDVTVIDSGVTDNSFSTFGGYQLDDSQQFSLRASRYRSENAGFGFVEPDLIGDEPEFRIRIRYPFQDFDRYAFEYIGVPDAALADSVRAQLYYQSNQRQLANDIEINIGPLFPGAPNSVVEADTLNFTDLETLGLRAELTKAAGDHHLVTWGIEAFEDDSFNTDFSTTTTRLRFPGPPFEVSIVATDDVANTPNATNTSYGVFVQDAIAVTDRLSVTAGARYQNVSTAAEATPGWDITGLDFDDASLVGAVNAVYSVTEYLNVVGSYGTAFRAPNIVERLFNGLTPEGAGFQILNRDLVSEDSANFDFGLKYRRRNAIFEATWFRNDIEDGIVQHFLSPQEQALLPEDTRDEINQSGVRFVVQQRNADRLRYEGVELAAGYRSERGLQVGANMTFLDADRINSDNPPTGDTFSDKFNTYVRWDPKPRYWLEYRVRHNGSDDANLDPNEPVPPIGRVLPSFSVHTLAGGVTLFERGGQKHTLGLMIDNLTDELYAEFSNATFFRPQPGRNIVATYRVGLGQ